MFPSFPAPWQTCLIDAIMSLALLQLIGMFLNCISCELIIFIYPFQVALAPWCLTKLLLLLVCWNMTTVHCSTTTYSCPMTEAENKIQEQQEIIVSLQQELEAIKARVLSLSTIPDKFFHLWTNLPNRAVFNGLCQYLHSRGGGNLKYWQGQVTEQHRHFRDCGMLRRPGP